MGKRIIESLVLIMLVMVLSGCVTPFVVGSGQKFVEALNPRADKYALIYLYRKDGAFTKGLTDFPPYLVAKLSPGSDIRYPVVILGDRMYRPMLFEPGEVTFSVKAAGSETVILKAGETRCIEASRSFRGVTVIGVNETRSDVQTISELVWMFGGYGTKGFQWLLAPVIAGYLERRQKTSGTLFWETLSEAF